MKKRKVIQFSRDILEHYAFEYPKSMNDELSSPQLSWAPNHPNVTEESLDRPILHNLNAKVFCHECERVVGKMESSQMRVFGKLLRKRYLNIEPTPAKVLWTELGISRRVFFRKVDKAIYYFGEVLGDRKLKIMEKYSNNY